MKTIEEMFRQACTIEESIDGEVLVSDRFSFVKLAPCRISPIHYAHEF